MEGELLGEISKAFGKGLLWTFLTVIFGLLQLWFVIANDFVITNFNLNVSKIITDGTLLFFTSAVVSAICTDYYLGKNSELNKIASLFIYFIYPILVMVCCIWLFSLNFSSYNESLDVEKIANIQISIIVMTILYAIVTKAIMYFQEDR